MAALSDLGNNSGFLYIVDYDGVSVISSLKNNTLNVKKLLTDALTSGPLPPNTGIFSTSYGRRYFINSAGGAVQGDLTGATEISRNVILRGLESSLPVNNYTIATGALTPLRDASVMVVNVDTEGLAASDNLDSISTTDFNTGDIVIFRGVNAARIVTFRSGMGNITLTSGVNFLTGNQAFSISLQYISGSGWFEISRTPSLAISVSALRNAGLAIPVQGVELTALASGGGTINLEPGVDKGYQVFNGTATLAASWVIQIQGAPATPYLDGDEMIVDFRALLTVGANSVTIFGITLTDIQALEGRIILYAKYKLSNTTWYYKLVYDASGVDVTNKAYVDTTFEPDAGLPAADGYIWSSSAAGVRSWIPNTAGGSSYINPASMPSAVGGYPAGTSFPVAQSLQEMFDGLLYPYQNPAFTAFSISGQATTIEAGASVAAGIKTFNWNTSNAANVAVNSVYISDLTAGSPLAGPIANDFTEAITFASAITIAGAGSYQWKIQATNTQSGIFNSLFTVTWLFKKYIGTSANVVLTEAQIEALVDAQLSAAPAGTYLMAAGGYKYFAWPDSLGSPVASTGFKDASTLLPISMATVSDNAAYSNIQNGWSYALISVTNALGVTTNYRLYRSQFTLGGSITIIVS